MFNQRKFKIIVLSLFILSVNSVLAQALSPTLGQSGLFDAKSIELYRTMTTPVSDGENELFVQAGTDSTTTPKAVPFELIKSPRKALLLSAVLPGAGELYAKSYISSVLFLGLEVTMWIMYNKYENKGKDLEAEFIKFADSNWRVDIYNAWISGSTESIALTLNEAANRTHDLPVDANNQVAKTQQYYEMIGKYDQFYAGWKDSGWEIGASGLSHANGYTYDGLELSPLRAKYVDMREDSNLQLKNASRVASVAILNHIISAVDAAWCSYRYNKNYARKHNTSFRFDTIKYAQEVCPAFSLDMRW